MEKIKIGCTMRCSKIEICYNRELLMISQKSNVYIYIQEHFKSGRYTYATLRLCADKMIWICRGTPLCSFAFFNLKISSQFGYIGFGCLKCSRNQCQQSCSFCEVQRLFHYCSPPGQCKPPRFLKSFDGTVKKHQKNN